MSDTSPICSHGSLRRQCQICELRDELAAMTIDRDNLRGSYDHVRGVLVKALGMPSHEHRPLEYYARLIVEKQDNLEAKRGQESLVTLAAIVALVVVTVMAVWA